MTDLFNELSSICNPQDGREFLRKFRIQQLEADLQLHLTAMNDIEIELQTLKNYAPKTDTPKTHPINTLGDDLSDDYDMAHPV